MVYFSNEEVDVLRDMIACCDECTGNHIPTEYSEIIGVIRFKIESGIKYDFDNTEDSKGGVAE